MDPERSRSRTQTLEEPDDLKAFIPGKGIIPRLRRRVRGMCVISYSHPQSLAVFKSPQAIANERVKQLTTAYYMIHPFSLFRLRWELLMIIVLTLSLVLIPFYLAFIMEADEGTEVWVHVMFVLDIFCMIDICITFLTGHFKEENKEINLDMLFVSKMYLKGLFAVDLISSLPLDTILHYMSDDIVGNVAFYTQLISLVKVFRIKSLFNYINRWIARRRYNPVMLQALRALFLIMMYIHWMTCLAYLIPLVDLFQIRPAQRGTWIANKKMWTMDKQMKYLMCMFRAMSMMLCISYGDSPPSDEANMFFAMFSLILGFVIMVVIIALVDRLTRSVNTSAVRYVEKVAQVREYMRHKMMPGELQERIFQYYEFRYQKTYINEGMIQNILTKEIRQDVMLHNCRLLVENVTFFNNLPTEVLVPIVTCLEIEIYLANDVIFKAGSDGDSMYFISTGTVAMFSSIGLEIFHLEDGAHFGEISLVRGTKRMTSIVAVEDCELFRLDRADFMRVVWPFPDMLSKVEQIATDRVEFINQLDDEYCQRKKAEAGEVTSARKSAVKRKSKAGSTIEKPKRKSVSMARGKKSNSERGRTSK